MLTHKSHFYKNINFIKNRKSLWKIQMNLKEKQ